MSAAEPFLEVHEVSRRYGALEALAPTSFAIRLGEIVALVGANGSGKSVLLRAVVGGLVADETAGGRVTLRGHDLADREQAARVRADRHVERALGHARRRDRVEERVGEGVGIAPDRCRLIAPDRSRPSATHRARPKSRNLCGLPNLEGLRRVCFPARFMFAEHIRKPVECAPEASWGGRSSDLT